MREREIPPPPREEGLEGARPRGRWRRGRSPAGAVSTATVVFDGAEREVTAAAAVALRWANNAAISVFNLVFCDGDGGCDGSFGVGAGLGAGAGGGVVSSSCSSCGALDSSGACGEFSGSSGVGVANGVALLEFEFVSWRSGFE